MQHLIVILDREAPSFCFYPNPESGSERMDLETLKHVIAYAQKHNLLINFLVGDIPLPESYLKEIDVICHIFIRPFNSQPYQPDDIVVMEQKDTLSLANHLFFQNVILHVDRSDLPNLANTVSGLLERSYRTNVTLRDIDRYTEDDFETYREQLQKLATGYKASLLQDKRNELNLLSDRLVLHEMNNCNAGVENMTVSPEGKFYICPAFYYENREDCIGDLSQGLSIPNGQLYKLAYAPLCRKCDAYQCKRCVWLNRKTTLEVNTPSHEQCVISHLERNASRELQKQLYPDGWNGWVSIPEIDYLDPLECRRLEY